MLPIAVARSSSDGIAIRYVLPVLRMTSLSCLKHDVIFMKVPHVAVGLLAGNVAAQAAKGT